MNYKHLLCAGLCLLISLHGYASDQHKPSKKKGWAKSEYSGKRDDKSVRSVLLSKSFAWLSGSPADNEILSIGKSSQFFGFVALRYESGRAAKRGSIGRAFYQIASPEQRAILLAAVREKAEPQANWWKVRSAIMDHFEATLYTGHPLDEKTLESLGMDFGWLNAQSAFYEARAIADLEALLTEEQWSKLNAIRKNPDLANQMAGTDKTLKELSGLNEEERAHYEDLFAKAFSWLTGSPEQREIIPRGQPAQFFGFVAIRQKSGHGASRGKIAKSFEKILNHKQLSIIDQTVAGLKPWVKKYMATRNELLAQLALLRTDADKFDQYHYREVAEKLGVLEVICGSIEATAYEKIERKMSAKQTEKIASLRSDYILDEKQISKSTPKIRGEKIMNLCSSCHNRHSTVAPSIDGIVGKPIASQKYHYSNALQVLAEKQGTWTPENLDAFLQSPQKAAPGTIMTFKGLSNKDDRAAIINHLQSIK